MRFAGRPRKVIASFVVTLLACASCRSHAPAARPAAAGHPIAATAPSAETRPPDAVERLSALHPPLKRQWLAYRAKEGDAHRAAEFADLAMQLDATCLSGDPVRRRTQPADRAREIEVLSFLGLPDCGAKAGAAAVYVYTYWRPDTQSKWVAVVQVKDGLLEQVGWNEASVNDFSALRQYRTWSDVLGNDDRPRGDRIPVR